MSDTLEQAKGHVFAAVSRCTGYVVGLNTDATAADQFAAALDAYAAALRAEAQREAFEDVLAKFDAQFGTDGPEANSDSEGRGAGCDDCAESVQVRAEHRAFVAAYLTRQAGQ